MSNYTVSVESIENSKDGILSYSFSHEISEVNSIGPVEADLTLKSLGDFLEVTGHVSGVLKLQCDVCLNDFEYDFDFDAGEGFFAGHKPLVINDLFEDEQDTYNFARDNLNKIKNICTEVIPKAKEDLHKKLTELAQNFRTSEFIANLRNLTGKSA